MNFMYILRRAAKMDWKKMASTAKTIAKQTYRPFTAVFTDIVRCGVRYGAGYMDYQVFRLWECNEAQRATYLTRTKNQEFCRQLNDPERSKAVENKVSFCRLYGRFLGREWLDASTASEEEKMRWFRHHPVFFAKDPDGICGKEVQKADCTALSAAEYPAFAARLISDGLTLWEEAIVQSPEMAALAPDSVNTVRVMTLIDGKGEVHLLGAFLRMGVGAAVDNLDYGGCAAKVSLDTGKIDFPAQDKTGATFAFHPKSGTNIQGFQVPQWEAVMSMVRQAAQIEPTVRYLGWDAAITERGPLLIEANTIPSNHLCQLPAQSPKHEGILPFIQSILANGSETED
ncbi:MAG: hypothetical protein LBR73_09770 [Oscillospiraceae bacterium]|jgi:hypothetical protein|nr:hypothetical protein [Oscillospiraceae bacterium]